MSTATGTLADRFRQAIRDDGVLLDGMAVVVALSGGIDSVALLHLLRFTPGLPNLRVRAAHFDHGMRPESPHDASWVRGLCRAWRTPLHVAAATIPMSSETEAREARYGFLSKAKEEAGAAWILTGHQADDQAETILQRAVRGTGLRGLGGIPRTRPPGLYRPLLPFTREQLSRYMAENRVTHREDRSNLDLDISRNLLRHSVFPLLEKGPAPGAREALRRLGRLARETEAAWDSVLPRLLEPILDRDERGDFVVRSALLTYHPAVQARLLRTVFQRAGIELDEVGTRVAVEFTTSGASGKSLSLPGGKRWIREFDRFRLEAERATVESVPIVLDELGEGTARLSLAGSSFEVVWGFDDPRNYPHRFSASEDRLKLPLALRGWEPGDRVEFPYGRKTLMKLVGEAGLPVREREQSPVLQDGLGRVLWVPGIALSTLAQISPGFAPFFMGIRNVDER